MGRVTGVTDYFAGRYELLEQIATGGMGTVWCVRDHADGLVKAAKILGQSDAGSLLRFVREQSMRIDHRHVVTPQSWAGVDDRVLFTMPMVRGGSVADLLRDHGRLPVRWVGELLDQTLQALEAVHAAGIVHRDVKPANLLLEPTGAGRPHVRLTDFGIAAPVDEPRMTRASMAIGTPGYMAPEQWRGADPDPRADLYAVAAVGVEMLTGVRPPSDPNPLDVAALHTGDEPTDRLLALLATALAGDPNERPASASGFRTRLAGLGLATLPPAPDERVSVPDRYPGLAGATPSGPTRASATSLDPTGVPQTHVLAAPPPRAPGLPLAAIVLLVVGAVAVVGGALLLI